MLSVFSDQFAHRYVFHYTAPSTFVDWILPSLQLRMSRFANVNDPRESREWICSLTVPGELMGTDWDVVGLSERFTAHMKSTAKLLCVTRDNPDLDPDRPDHLYGRGYAHPSMWDRYAAGHAGVCLILDTDCLVDAVARAADGRGDVYRQGVSYQDQPIGEARAYTLSASAIAERGEEAVFSEHQLTYMGDLYFWKSKDWSVEFEYRWLVLDGGDDDLYVDISTALAGVVFGDRFPVDQMAGVEDALVGHDITLARIKYRNGHPIVLPYRP